MWGKAVLITTTVVAAVVLIVNPATSQQVESAQTLEPQRSSTQLAPSPDTRLKKITLDNLDPTRVRQVAFERTQRKIRESKPARDQSRHYLTPNVDRKLVRLARKQIPVMGGFYKDLVTVSDFNFLWANSRDGENLKQLFCEKLKQCLQIKPSEFCNLGTGANYYAYCHNSGADKNLFAMYLMHGYTHAVQASLGTNHMPNWFGEGTAQYFENHFARIHYGIKDRNFKPDFTNTIRTLYTNQKLVPFRENASEQNFIDALTETDNRFPRNGREQAQLGYYPGALAVEALIAAHGIDTLFTFWKNSQRKDFYVAFEDSYGITTSEFYKKLAPYAVAMIKQDRK